MLPKRDDILHAVKSDKYRDDPVVCDGNLVTCPGTEDLPDSMRMLLAEYGGTSETKA